MIDEDSIHRAAELLRQGGLVAFPTETVYGLGADARNASAIQRIFQAKGRPAGNPLIVHVADAAAARRYARQWPQTAQRLATTFWPGPLTLVLPKSAQIVAEVTAGKETVGLRCPDHPLALALLGEFDGPLAGPSANPSNRLSPTTAEHVRLWLGEKVDLILDGGACGVGIESTVIDLSGDQPMILRPGGIARGKIEEIIGPVEMADQIVDPMQAASSPGQQAVHYSPRTPAFRFGYGQLGSLLAGRPGELDRAIILLLRKYDRSRIGTDRITQMPDSPAGYARALYARLHEADSRGADSIWIEMPPDLPEWTAIRDRIQRATKPT